MTFPPLGHFRRSRNRWDLTPHTASPCLTQWFGSVKGHTDDPILPWGDTSALFLPTKSHAGQDTWHYWISGQSIALGQYVSLNVFEFHCLLLDPDIRDWIWLGVFVEKDLQQVGKKHLEFVTSLCWKTGGMWRQTRNDSCVSFLRGGSHPAVLRV